MIRASFLAMLLMSSIGLTLSPSSAEAGLFRRCCPPPAPVCCEPTVEVQLLVCNPCTGCKVPVCVCVPLCCAAEYPSMCGKRTIIGQGKVVISWCCGHEVVVRFDRHGCARVL